MATAAAPPAPELKLGVPLLAQTKKGEYAFFKVQHTDKTKLLTIEAIPANKTSDPDLYVSAGVVPLTATGSGKEGDGNGLATKNCYHWKSALVGRDRVDVHPSDAHAVSGWYTIGVLGYTDVTDFIVSAVSTDVLPFKELNGKFPVNDSGAVNTTKYYHCLVDDKERSTVFIRCKPQSETDTIALYASSDIMYPHADLCRWKCVGKPGEGVSVEFDSHDFKYGKPDCYIAIEVLPSTAMVVVPNDSTSPSATPTAVSDTAATAASDAKSSPAPATSPTAVTSNSVVSYALVYQAVLEDDLLTPELAIQYRRFKALYAGVDGGRVSQSERKKDDAISSSKSFTYGEITFPTFSQLLEFVKPVAGEVFYDLGCGTGKPVFAAHYIAPFSKCVGIELLPGLYQCCDQLVTKYRNDQSVWKSPTAVAATELSVPASIPVSTVKLGTSCRVGVCSFVCDDMTAVEWWRDADVVYTSSICFEDSLFKPLTKLMEKMKSGSRVITLKMPDSEMFDVLERGWWKMSWGKCTVYVLKKK